MPTLVLDDASVVLNSVDLSDHVKSVSISYSAEMHDDTAMGDNTKSNKGGLKDWSLDVTFHQDYAASSVDATLFPLVGSTFAVVVKPTSGAVSATNPSYSATGILESYTPMGGGVGELAETSAAIKPANHTDLTRATA